MTGATTLVADIGLSNWIECVHIETRQWAQFSRAACVGCTSRDMGARSVNLALLIR